MLPTAPQLPAHLNRRRLNCSARAGAVRATRGRVWRQGTDDRDVRGGKPAIQGIVSGRPNLNEVTRYHITHSGRDQSADYHLNLDATTVRIVRLELACLRLSVSPVLGIRQRGQLGLVPDATNSAKLMLLGNRYAVGWQRPFPKCRTAACFLFGQLMGTAEKSGNWINTERLPPKKPAADTPPASIHPPRLHDDNVPQMITYMLLDGTRHAQMRACSE